MIRLLPLLLLLAFPMACAAGNAANSRTASTTVTQTTPASKSPYCLSDPHTGVHDPDRLTIVSPCTELVGTVVSPPKLNAPDGDVTLNVRPDSAYASMMNAKNQSEGGLHVEIVPQDQPGCTPEKLKTLTVNNLGSCTGANVTFPPLNARVRVVGPYVFDRWVGWNEIHPAWHIEILPPTGPPPPEQHTFKATMTGKAAPLHKGAPRGTGTVAITATGGTICWRFSNVRGIGAPTGSQIAPLAGTRSASAFTLKLGRTFKRTGCLTPSRAMLERVVGRPRTLYVTVFASGYSRGAIRGQLVPTSD
jgi:hypothetical protein